MKKHKSQLRSNCCNANVKVGGMEDFEGDKKACTMYHVCTKCNNACDVHANPRKVWTINPETRIVPNKRKDQQKKLAEKEISSEDTGHPSGGDY